METLNLEKFNPTVAELNAMVEATKGITATDLSDKTQLTIVKENRIALKKARVVIEKRGKELREEANAFSKAVIAKEKELIAIIEPEEIRLAEIEEKAKDLAIREERSKKLPERKARLEKELLLVPTDESLNEMDDATFEAYFNRGIAERNSYEAARIKEELAKQKAEIEAREAKLREEQREIERKKELAETERRVREETEKRMHEEALRKEKELKERAEREVIELKARAEKEAMEAKAKSEREAQEKKEREEKAALALKEQTEKLAQNEKYNKFLVSHGWSKATEADFKIEDNGKEVVLFKRLGTFKK